MLKQNLIQILQAQDVDESFSATSPRGRQTSIRMRSPLQCLALCAVLSLCVCYDLFVSPNRANSFIPPQRGNAYNLPTRGNSYNYYNYMRRIKSPAERRAETCEDYSPCRFYAYSHGYQQAYQRYFGSRNPAQMAARPRRY
ncbi:matrix Gla protein isoform X2 [Thalassophryne amazonica]|uniref:matrix Gla protein isoform X2 n=2 Tax=Thalassophryne amazonica TaxID=390379 RepID=UPI001471FCDB|nr:matrix Gla protein isoform X2 [Thalassophryne amazonica]